MIHHIYNITLDIEKHCIRQAGKEVRLTHLEYALFVYLFQHSNRICSREEILDQVWGQRFQYDTGTIDVHLHAIRRKLGFTRQSPIETIRGIGIIFHKENKQQTHILNIQQFASEWIQEHEADFAEKQLTPSIKLDPFVSEITLSPKSLHEMLDGILNVLLPISKPGIFRLSSKLSMHHFSLSIDMNGTVNELRIPLVHT